MSRYRLLIISFLSLAILAGCSGTKKSSSSRGGGYYLDDGPGSNIPANIEAIPDAQPRIEVHAKANFRPYTVFGKRYFPVSDQKPFRQEGTASWYGRKFHGNKTANGETYDMYAMSAAHPTLPIPSYARVTRASSGKSVVVRINDRGPFHSARIIDLSYVAAAKLGIVGPGSGQVIVEAITNDDIRNNRHVAPNATPIAPAAPPRNPAPQVVQALPVKPNALQLASRAPQVTPDALQVLQDSELNPEPKLPAKQLMVGNAAHVYLQFGAFSMAETAESLASKLNRQINLVESRVALVDNANNLYRVQIGPYPSRTAAVNAAVNIRQATGMQPTIALH
ncbi:septal ring lytic transglycosylase RlpA family protein [Candidimonas sp. SYP-B2681]|uniref:septal ring lytic transglycosylase RlpA family protein n=1 Tax=Candidimonas sp. SYP-B2681 TaxID=2497686 RepID=UPI000F881F70|nr:septal ring lytic transglycosylase RlpA family protein [Candidimonas sp. SYP-B2681]RTZ43126.1 septal ring lytic transglycosylase RlpA family protein [Candidimonas sp. SYP-B2681]